MKKNLLKSILALLLVTSLFALASCAGLSKVVDQIQDAVENAGENNSENGNGNETENNGEATETGNGNTNENEGGNNETNENAETGNTEDEEVDAFKITFVTDANSSVTVYPTQDLTTGGSENATETYALDKDGEPTKEEEAGQVNFVVVLADGYEVAGVSITPTDGYNKLKGGMTETGNENGYRITKIKGDLTVTITTKATGTAENLEDGYAVTFVVDEHATVTVFKTQDMTAEGEENATVAYSRNGSTGALLKDGKGQVNFLVVVEDGYEIAGVTAAPTDNYNNLKGYEDTGVENGYRLTKITGEVTVTVTTKLATAATEE